MICAGSNSGVLLESADLTDADLTRRGRGPRSYARRTRRPTFARRSERGANLSLTRCEDTDFSDACSIAACSRTRFFRVLPAARFDTPRPIQTLPLPRADFSEATLSDLAFIEQTFHDVRFKTRRSANSPSSSAGLNELRFGGRYRRLGIRRNRRPGDPFRPREAS